MIVMNISWPKDKSNEECFEKKPKTFSHNSMLRIGMQISTKPVTVKADSLTLRPISHTSGDGRKDIFPPHQAVRGVADPRIKSRLCLQGLMCQEAHSGSRGESGVGAAEGRETKRRFSGNWGEVMTANPRRRGKSAGSCEEEIRAVILKCLGGNEAF